MSLFVIKDKRFVTFSFYLVRAYQEAILYFSPRKKHEFYFDWNKRGRKGEKEKYTYKCVEMC